MPKELEDWRSGPLPLEKRRKPEGVIVITGLRIEAEGQETGRFVNELADLCKKYAGTHFALLYHHEYPPLLPSTNEVKDDE